MANFANGSYAGSSYDTDGENADVFPDNSSDYADGYDSEYLESAPVQLITLEQVHELARNISKHFIDSSNVAKTLTAEQREELKWNIIEALEQLDRVVKAHDSLQRENEAVQDEIRQRIRDTQKLQDACKTLQKFLEECEDTEERMKEELRAMVAECSKERQENERLRHLLEEESGNLVSDNNRHEESLDETAVINFEQTISQLKEMNKALRQQLALRETELETERDKVDELESFIDEVEHVCVSLKTKVEKLETEVNDLEGEREQLSAESENQRLKIDHLGKMLEASKKISVSRSISVESMRNQKTFFDEFNAMQTVVETEYDSDGEVQGQNQLNQKNEIFGDNTLRNQQSHESLSQVEATYAEVIQEFQKFSELQHVCMDLAEEFVSLDLNQKPAESLQSQQEMKYKINGAFEVLSTQLQPMEYAEDVKEKFASFLEIQKSNPSFEAKQQVLSVVTRFIKNSSHSVFEESFPILAISLMETAKWDNSSKQKQNEEPEPDEATNAADETITAENITTVEIKNSKQLQTAKTETVEVENEEIIPTQIRLRSSEMFLPDIDQTTTTNSENSNNRLAEPDNDNTERIEDGEPSCAFGSESRTDQLAESPSAAAEVSEHKESVEEIDHHEGKTERSETMNSETSGEESRLNERIPSTREGSIYINSLPTPTNNPSQPNYPSSLLKSEQKIVTKTTAEISTQTNDLVPDIVEPVERPGGKVKLGRRQTIWTSNASKSGYRPRSPRSSMRRGVAGGWRSGRAMSITSGGPEPTLETASPLPSHKQMLAHQSTIDLLGQSDSNKDERLKWYKEQKIEPSKMLKTEVNTAGGLNKGAVDVSKVMERMSDQNQQPLYTPDGRYLLIDPFDPERPRYTKTELMQVIEEKASLCIDKMNLQEELNNVRRELEDLRKATVTMTQRWFEDSNTMKRNQQHSKPSAIRRLFGIFSGRPNSFSRGRHHNRGPRGEFIPSRNPNEPRRLSHPTVLETDSNSAPLMIHELPLTLFNSDTHATRGRTATENQSRNTTIEQNPAINSTRDNHSPTSRYSPFLYKRFSAKYAQKDKSVTLNYPSSRNNSPANQVNVDGPQSPELFSPATD